jgi:hypothetical protein
MYTKAQVIAKRHHGLKTFDKTLAFTTIEELIDETVRINKEMPNIWDPGWSNFNLDECLTPIQLADLSTKTGIALPFTPSFERKP